jgi:hypothetical protein
MALAAHLLVSGCEWIGALPPPLLCACIGMSWGDMSFCNQTGEVPLFVCLRSSCSHVTGVGEPYFCENRAEGYHAKCRGLCGCNPTITP